MGNVWLLSRPSFIKGFKKSISTIKEIVSSAIIAEIGVDEPLEEEKASLPPIRCRRLNPLLGPYKHKHSSHYPSHILKF